MHPLAGAIARLSVLALLAVTLGSTRTAGADHLYVSNTGSFNVSGFTINLDGSLTPVPGSPYPVGEFPGGGAVDSKGRFLYVESDSTIYGFHINSDGSLTPLAGSPFAVSPQPGALTVVSESRGDFLYVGNPFTDTVSVYAIDLATGALTLKSSVPAGTTPFGQAVGRLEHPRRSFLYVTNFGSNNISAYEINRFSGALRPVSGSPFASGPNPFGIAADPSAQFAYVASNTSNSVSAYNILRKGGLAPVCTSVATDTGPAAVVVDPKDRFVYAANQGPHDISAYTISLTDGCLTPVPGSPFPGPDVGDLHYIAIEPNGQFLYGAHFSYATDNISGFTINSDGSLTPLPGSPFAQLGWAATFIAITPF